MDLTSAPSQHPVEPTPASALTSEVLGDRIRDVRESLGMTQTALATAVDANLSVVSKLEAGRTQNPNVFLVEAICRHLGLTLEALLDPDEVKFRRRLGISSSNEKVLEGLVRECADEMALGLGIAFHYRHGALGRAATVQAAAAKGERYFEPYESDGVAEIAERFVSEKVGQAAIRQLTAIEDIGGRLPTELIPLPPGDYEVARRESVGGFKDLIEVAWYPSAARVGSLNGSLLHPAPLVTMLARQFKMMAEGTIGMGYSTLLLQVDDEGQARVFGLITYPADGYGRAFISHEGGNERLKEANPIESIREAWNVAPPATELPASPPATDEGHPGPFETGFPSELDRTLSNDHDELDDIW